MITPPPKLGERVTVYTELGYESPYLQKGLRMPPMTGTVVYVHPLGRWYTVEFETKLGRFRESYCSIPYGRSAPEPDHEGWRRLRSARARPEHFLAVPEPHYRSDCK